MVHIALLSIHTRLTFIDFSMPSVNSILPFLESIRPESNPTWHIRRCRLLDSYESIWAVPYDDANHSTSIILHGEPHFKEEGSKYFLLCLVPKAWNISLGTGPGSNSRLRRFCSRLTSSKSLGSIVGHDEFFNNDE